MFIWRFFFSGVGGERDSAMLSAYSAQGSLLRVLVDLVQCWGLNPC